MDDLDPPNSCNVYTPDALAKQMVASLFPNNDQFRWLEPCVGKGAILTALNANSIDPKNIRGVDLCKTAELADQLAQVIRGVEFLKWALTTSERFDCVVANPPYIAISRLPAAVQLAAMQTIGPDGTRVTKGANCWLAFLCASLSLLKPGGSFAFVLPASYEYADYALRLRRLLPNKFESVALHRCVAPIFDVVDDGSVVLICRGFGLNHKSNSRSEHKSLTDLIAALKRSSQKAVKTSRRSSANQIADGTRFGDLASVGLGAVTGDAAFFLMSETRRLELGLPKKAVVPVLTRSRHLALPIIDRKSWENLVLNNERVWMFRPAHGITNHSAVKAYMASTQAEDMKKTRYKVKSRNIWYRPTLPIVPDGFMSGMTINGPWICLNEMKRLSATNTLYVVRFHERLTRDDICAWSLMFLTSVVKQQWSSVSRKYALGLCKLEPSDISGLILPRPKLMSGTVELYKEAVKLLLRGDHLKAIKIADSHVAHSGKSE
ncbi:MAG: hypothetical protein WCH39_18705 [Schlesneria sp.]